MDYSVPPACATTLEKEWKDQHSVKFPAWIKEHLDEKSCRSPVEQDYLLTVLTNNHIRCHYQLASSGITQFDKWCGGQIAATGTVDSGGGPYLDKDGAPTKIKHPDNKGPNPASDFVAGYYDDRPPVGFAPELISLINKARTLVDQSAAPGSETAVANAQAQPYWLKHSGGGAPGFGSASVQGMMSLRTDKEWSERLKEEEKKKQIALYSSAGMTTLALFGRASLKWLADYNSKVTLQKFHMSDNLSKIQDSQVLPHRNGETAESKLHRWASFFKNAATGTSGTPTDRFEHFKGIADALASRFILGQVEIMNSRLSQQEFNNQYLRMLYDAIMYGFPFAVIADQHIRKKIESRHANNPALTEKNRTEFRPAPLQLEFLPYTSEQETEVRKFLSKEGLNLSYPPAGDTSTSAAAAAPVSTDAIRLMISKEMKSWGNGGGGGGDHRRQKGEEADRNDRKGKKGKGKGDRKGKKGKGGDRKRDDRRRSPPGPPRGDKRKHPAEPITPRKENRSSGSGSELLPRVQGFKDHQIRNARKMCMDQKLCINRNGFGSFKGCPDSLPKGQTCKWTDACLFCGDLLHGATKCPEKAAHMAALD
jgi:hypothetical protein